MVLQVPTNLSVNSTRFWTDTIKELNLTKQYQLVTLEMACRALDEIEAARKLIKKDGMTIATQHSKKMNPALSIERGAREDFVRCMRQLRPRRDEQREEARKSKFHVLQFPNRRA
jgi:phage terminase small subunit